MESKILDAALAALIHNLSKFSDGAKLVSNNSRVASETSSRFVDNYVPPDWRSSLMVGLDDTGDQVHLSAWVRLAEKLTSAVYEGGQNQAPGRLLSIFSFLAGHNQPMMIPLHRLNPSEHESLFPKPAVKATAQGAYSSLWKEFEEACQSWRLLQSDNRNAYLEKLFSLLQEFTWCLPAGGVDISLFDKSRSCAAIAACLAGDNRTTEWCQNAQQHQEQLALLVGGDLSGLQKFIYTLASSGAAKSLRARSFYLQIISEVIAQFVLTELGLPISSLLYVGGGGFQILAPVAASDRLPKIARDLTDRLLTLHGGELGLSLSWVPVNASDILQFNGPRDRLAKALNIQKRKPFQAASAQLLNQMIGQPLAQGGDPVRFCQVTGEDGEAVEQDRDGVYKSKFVLSLEELGRALPTAVYLTYSLVAPEKPAKATHWHTALRCFGANIELLGAKTTILNKGPIRLWNLVPGSNLDQEGIMATEIIPSYHPFARLTPLTAQGIPLTFDDLAVPRRGHFERWGVLRMDVDNLGLLFQKGFQNAASLARVSSLSTALRLFFEGWLPSLAAPGAYGLMKEADLSDKVYIQYSGGDDLFVVGAWDALPEFALRIRQSFREYTIGNPALTLSGGVALARKGFPLYQAAEQAGEAEGFAKAYRRDNELEKDAFTFLGLTLDWPTFEKISGQAYELAEAVATDRLPHSLLQTILTLNTQIQQARQQGHKYQYGRWTWLAAYQLTRLAISVKDDRERTFIGKLRDRYLMPSPETESLGLAARWAQFLTRGG